MKLAKVSYAIRNGSKAEKSDEPLYKNFLYSRMLWGKWLANILSCLISSTLLSAVSIAMKFHDARGAPVFGEVQKRWNNYLIQFRHRVNIMGKIEEFKKGIEVGRLLKLPHDLCCNSEYLCELLVTEQSVKPFCLLK